MKILTKTIAVAALALACACSGGNGWKLNGTIEGAEKGQKVALEGFNGARWFLIDSLSVGNNGNISYRAEEAPTHPDIYRLTYDGRTIYFPIDSIETLTVKANAATFDRNYVLEGSQRAADMQVVDQLIAASIDANGIDGALTDADLKRSLNEMLLADDNGLVSYYVINKTLGEKALYNPAVRKDLNMIGAIANKFNMYRPNDPRTKYLEERYLQGRRAAGFAQVTQIEAAELGFIDISLYNPKGEKVALSDVVNDNRLVLLNLTSFDVEASPAINIELNRVLSKYRDKGVEIYQVSFDQDELNWMTGAVNLPWVAVHAGANDAHILNDYNAPVLPVTFIIKDGSIIERVSDLGNLEQVVSKNL